MKPTRIWEDARPAKAADLPANTVTTLPLEYGGTIAHFRIDPILDHGNKHHQRVGRAVRLQRIMCTIEIRWPEFYTTKGEAWAAESDTTYGGFTSAAYGSKRRADLWFALVRLREHQTGAAKGDWVAEHAFWHASWNIEHGNIRMPYLSDLVSPVEQDWTVMCSKRVGAPQDGFFRDTHTPWPAPTDPDPIRWSTYGWNERRTSITLVWDGDLMTHFHTEGYARGEEAFYVLAAHEKRWSSIAEANWIDPEDISVKTRCEFIDAAGGF